MESTTATAPLRAAGREDRRPDRGRAIARSGRRFRPPRPSRPGSTECRFTDRFDQLFGVAYRAAFRILGERAACEDVAQETLMRALMRWARIESYADPWAARVATNLAIDAHRRRRRHVNEPEEIECGPHDAEVIVRDELRRALESLGSRQREALVLRLVDGFTVDETAAVMGISRAGVLKHTTRALGRLQGLLRDGHAADIA